MAEGMSHPFMPAMYDVVWSVTALGGLVLLAIALVRWFGSATSGLRSVAEVAVIVLLPILGPAAYLVATWSTTKKPRSGAASHS